MSLPSLSIQCPGNLEQGFLKSLLVLALVIAPFVSAGIWLCERVQVPSSSGSEGSGATCFPLSWSPLIRTFALSTLGKSKDPWRLEPVLCKWPAVSAKGNVGKRTNTADTSCNVPWETHCRKFTAYCRSRPCSLIPCRWCLYILLSDSHVYASITCLICRRQGK